MKLFKLLLVTISVFFGMIGIAAAGPVVAPIVTTIVGGGIGGAIARIGLSLAVSYITNKLFAPEIPGGAANPAVPDPGVKQRISTDTNNKLPVVYGKAKVFGSITFADITPDNQKMAFIVPIAEGPINSYETIYWDTYRLTFDGDITTGLRSVTNAEDLDGNSDDFLNEGRLRVRAYLGGSNNRPTHLEQFESANYPNTKWNDDASNRNMPNVAYLYAELTYDRDHGVTGLSGKFGAVINGKLIRPINGIDENGDITTDINEIVDYQFGGLTYSNNPAECLADYLTNSVYGAGNIVNDDSLNLETFYNHKLFCNESVNHTDSDGNMSNDLRFTTNGVVNTHDTRDVNISDLATNSGAIVSYQLGKFQLNTEKVGSSVATFNDDNIFGDITIVNDGFNSQLNKFTGSFISAANDYQDDQVFIDIPTNLQNDNEPEFIQETRFKFIDNNIMAERIGNVILKKSRETLVVSFTTDLSALRLQVHDIITIENDTYNFGTGNNQFRINSISETEIQNGMLGYLITAQKYNADVYADENIREFTPSANTNLPRGSNISEPTNFSVLSESESDGSITFTWNTAASGITHGFQIYMYTSATEVTDFMDDNVLNNRALIDIIEFPGGQIYEPGVTVTHTVRNIPGSPYLYFWIRAVNNFGFRTPLIGGIEVSGFIPSTITDLSVISIYKRALNAPTDLPSVNLIHTFNPVGSEFDNPDTTTTVPATVAFTHTGTFSELTVDSNLARYTWPNPPSNSNISNNIFSLFLNPWLATTSDNTFSNVVEPYYIQNSGDSSTFINGNIEVNITISDLDSSNLNNEISLVTNTGTSLNIPFGTPQTRIISQEDIDAGTITITLSSININETWTSGTSEWVGVALDLDQWAGDITYTLNNVTFNEQSATENIITGDPDVSNGWYVDPNDIPELDNSMIFQRQATVSNVDNVVEPLEWGAVTELLGGMATDGISSTTIQLYTTFDGDTLPDVLNDLRPTEYQFNFNNPGNIDIQAQPTGVMWQTNIPNATNTQTVYSIQAYVQTSTPDQVLTASDFSWGDVFIYRAPAFEVYSYIVQSGDFVPLAPAPESGVVTNGVLTTAPSKGTSTTTLSGTLASNAITSLSTDANIIINSLDGILYPDIPFDLVFYAGTSVMNKLLRLTQMNKMEIY